MAGLYHEHASAGLRSEDLEISACSLAVLGSAMRISPSLASYIAAGSDERAPAATFLMEAIKSAPEDSATKRGVISIAAAILGTGEDASEGIIEVVKAVLADEGADTSVL